MMTYSRSPVVVGHVQCRCFNRIEDGEPPMRASVQMLKELYQFAHRDQLFKGGVVVAVTTHYHLLGKKPFVAYAGRNFGGAAQYMFDHRDQAEQDRVLREQFRARNQQLSKLLAGGLPSEPGVRNPFRPSVRETERAKRTAVNVVQKRSSRR